MSDDRALSRLNTFRLFNLHLEKKDKLSTPAHLYPLPGDEGEPIEIKDPFDPEYDETFNKLLA